MKTIIFKTFGDFLLRTDLSQNGVSEEFAANNPKWEKENETNNGCWNCSDCSRCSGCFDCSDCSDCSRCSGCFDCFDCSRCSGCFDCFGCFDCSRCSGCFDCSGCSGCFDCSGCSGCSRLTDNKPQSFKMPETPIIENIHQKVLDAVTTKGELQMDTWHGDDAKNTEGEYCGTTHCRAGWVVALAGKSGVELESIFGTENAAMQIYKASSEIRVSPTRFYEKNEYALEDIKRCAEEEKLKKEKNE